MKRLLLVALLICGITTTSFARAEETTSTVTEPSHEKKTEKLIQYQGELNIGFATGGKLKNDAGEAVDTNFSRPFLETIHGVRIGNYLSAGVGVGLQYAYGDYLTGEVAENFNEMPSWNTVVMPLFLNLKGYYPVSEEFAPYISWSLGASTILSSDLNSSYSERHTSPNKGGYDYIESSETTHKGGFYYDFGVGFNYKKLNFSLGMMHQRMKLAYSESESWISNSKYNNSDGEEIKVKNSSFYVKIGLKF